MYYSYNYDSYNYYSHSIFYVVHAIVLGSLLVMMCVMRAIEAVQCTYTHTGSMTYTGIRTRSSVYTDDSGCTSCACEILLEVAA
jgi:hypothetical protein